MDEVYQAMRAAVADAQVGSDGQLDYRETSEIVGPVLIRQLVVTYVSGNEVLSLMRLQTTLSNIGKLAHFEYRGRGSHERPHVAATMTVGDQRYDLLYLLS